MNKEFDFFNSLRFFKKHPFYKNKLKGINNVENIPLMKKNEYSSMFRFINLNKVNNSCICASSGTTKEPILSIFSRKGYKSAVNRIVLSMKMANITNKDIILNTFSYGIFMAGFLYDNAARINGSCILPFGSGRITPTYLKLKLCKYIKPTVINGTPSYLLRVAEMAKENDTTSSILLNLKIGQLAGEVLSPELKNKMKTYYPNIEIFNQYGMTEAPSLAAECKLHDGMHVFSQDYYPEVLNLKNGKISECGKGELILTSNKNNFMPILRFKTGDYVELNIKPCKCELKSSRVKVFHRLDDLRKIKGILCNIQLLYELILDYNPHTFYLEYNKITNKLGLVTQYVTENNLLNKININVYNHFGIKIDYNRVERDITQKILTEKTPRLIEL